MRWRTVAAWAAASAIVLGAPLVGDLRLLLLRVFPRYYVAIVAGIVVAGGLLLLGWCARGITTERPRRLATLGLAVVLALGSFAVLRSGDPNVDAVEAFHFVEYGLLTLLVFPSGQAGARWEAYVQAALVATTVAIADEWLQWFVPGRAGEWRDVLFDLLATGCGLLLCLALDTRRREPFLPRDAHARGRGARLGLATAAVVMLFGAFMASIHLGYEIRDPDAGTFRSRFTAARLRELGGDRARRWASVPAEVPGRYAREDQYEAEALWHVRRRNFGMDRDRQGDPVELDVAWHENQILERHFEAVLNAPHAAHRLSPSQLADVDARRARAAAPFVSDAEAMPIYTWPSAIWWAAVLGLAATAVAAGVGLDRHRRRSPDV